MNQGYWGMPEATAESWSGGWFHTGDLMRQASDGMFYVAGRAKDRIRVRGENVNPDEVEAVLEACPGVEACAAVGRPMASTGEDQLFLFVVPKGPFDEHTIRAYTEENLPKFMRPKYVVEVEDLPMTPTGKIQRNILQDRLLASDDSLVVEGTHA